MTLKRHHRYGATVALGAALGALLASCAANPHAPPIDISTSNAITVQTLLEGLIPSARVQFDYANFYTLSSPNPAGCAGDVKTYRDPLSNRALASDLGNPTATIHPAFIKNVSLDITDSNSAAASNLAFGCSYGSGATTPAPSACASFDYGANAGISTELAGSVLMIGGSQGTMNGTTYLGTDADFNSSGLTASCGTTSSAITGNACGTSVFALGVDALPASTANGPISSFVNLATSSNYAGPKDFIGAAGAYDPGDNQFLLFGGSAVIGAVGAEGAATLTDSTWIFDLKQQKWTQLASVPTVDLTLERTFERDFGGARFLSNLITGRSNFGYTAVQGLAVHSMSNSATLNASRQYNGALPVDSTDRIVIAGGQDASGVVSDSYKFNPTYGPEWVDALGRAIENWGVGQNPAGNLAPAAGEPVQWMQSYDTEPLFNTTPSSITSTYAQLLSKPIGGSPIPVSNFGLTALRDNTNFPGSGYLLYIGGFDSRNGITQNSSTQSCPAVGPAASCAMMISRRSTRALGAAGGAGSGETFPANFASLGNLPFPGIGMVHAPPPLTNTNYPSSQIAPSLWDSYQGVNAVPYYGGASLVPGFNLQTNDVVFFGGADCSNYILSTATCASFANPGAYFTLGSDPLGAGASVPANIGFNATTPPARAGMSVARGIDPSGNPIIVAFGGMSAPGSGVDQNIYYLYNSGTLVAPAPKWVTATPGGGAGHVSAPGPAVPTNGAMVYSHVTGKFYLFGGFNPLANAQLGDTWELSVTGANCGTAGNCTFAWRQLNVTGGIACYPNSTCPQARRSHRMVEANYNQLNPGGTVNVVGLANGPSGESACSAAHPCSYGIFMEGGTADGLNPLSDRWMFDPTANAGGGAWTKMSEMPARTLSQAAPVDYAIPGTTQTAHRTILFGGETGFTNPSASSTGLSFVAPTLGDTWIYDFDAGSWNRVTLLGVGYNTLASYADAAGNTSSSYDSDEWHRRQAFDATNPNATDSRSINGNLSELSPPPTAGAVLATRTMAGPSTSGAPAASLKIPEIYMIGGRLKDGSWQPFDHVYKFCAGSTGEAYTGSPGAPKDGIHNAAIDLSCDAYNASTNASSLAPSSSYVGRWLRKQPSTTVGALTSTQLSSFMGAAAYDSYNDLIAVYGGLQFNTANGAVTNPAARVTSPNANYDGQIYEYSPPDATHFQGAWAMRPFCAGQTSVPQQRYGHSMIYDSQHKQFVVIGGYDLTGHPLVQAVSSISGTYSIPEIWAATRSPNFGAPCYMWRQITTIGNSFTGSNSSPPLLNLAHLIAAYVPASGYGTGFYSTFDASCEGVGPIASPDPNTSKLLAGGVYFDLDRTQLGANENLLLNLTFIPLGTQNQNANSAQLSSAERAVFRVHLVATGQSADQLDRVLQPRYLTYTGNNSYPEVVQTLSVLSPPTGQPRTEQLVIPLGSDATIDRIRFERFSGNAILIDASLFRMGQR